MVKSLIALAMIPRLMNPSQADMEDYVNNYINNTCQYLKYSYDQTQQKYILQDKVTTYNNQDAHTTFKFTLSALERLQIISDMEEKLGLLTLYSLLPL